MKKFKFVIAVLVIFIFSLKCQALDSFYKNTLKEIDVKKASGNGYLVNLIFDNNYTEPLAITKKGLNKHSIILPETQIGSKNLNIVYEEDQSKISLDVTQHPYIDQTITNGYVKILVETKENVPVLVASDKLAAKTEKKPDKQNIVSISQANAKAVDTTLPILEDIPMPQELIKDKISDINAIKHSDTAKMYTDIIIKIAIVIFVLAFSINQAFKIIKSIHDNVKLGLPKRDNQFHPINDKKYTNSKFKKQLEQINSEESLESSQLAEDKNQTPQTKPTPPMAQNTTTQATVKQTTKTAASPQTNPFDKKHLSNSPIEEEDPSLVSHARLANNKGVYLVNFEDKYSLLGYINDNIFVLKTFENLSRPSLQMRMNEKLNEKATYLARVGDYKSLIEVSKTGMKVLTEF